MGKIKNKLACTVCGFIEEKPFDVFDECKFKCGGHYMPYDGPIIYVGALRHARHKVYDLVKQQYGTRKYGNCEICGNPADEIYSYKNIFGHKDCLIEMIKNKWDG